MRRSKSALGVSALLAAISIATGVGADPAGPVDSGPSVGDRVSTFYVRAVTGSLRGKSVCYVCRNGDRPVVMLFIREVTPELRSLLKGIDEVVDAQRASGLRSFGVFLAGREQDLLPEVQTLGFEDKLNLPLTVAAAGVDGPTGQNIHPDAAITVVLYRDQIVESRFVYRRGELNADAVRRIVEATGQLAK